MEQASVDKQDTGKLPYSVSSAEWEKLGEEFKVLPSENVSPVRVTLLPDHPLFPYGEKGGAVRGFFRRIIRRCIRWYMQPYIEEQNRINRDLLSEIERLEQKIAVLEKK